MKERITREYIYNPLPKVIETHYPMVGYGDIEEIIERMVPKTVPDKYKDYAQFALFRLHLQTAPECSCFTGISAMELAALLEKRVISEQLKNPQAGIVIMDRNIKSQPNNRNIFRLDISRGADGAGAVTRPGATDSPQIQLNNLISWATSGGFDEIIFIDDVLAFGDTTNELTEIISTNLTTVKVRILVGIAISGGGFNGVENTVSRTGISPEQLCLIKASSETNLSLGAAVPTSRDFTIFGGKVARVNGGVPRSYPYFLPFSLPNKSFMPTEKQRNASELLLEYNRQLVSLIEEFNGEPFILQSLVNAGFAIPSSNIEGLQKFFSDLDPKMPIQLFLNYSENVLRQI